MRGKIKQNKTKQNKTKQSKPNPEARPAKVCRSRIPKDVKVRGERSD